MFPPPVSGLSYIRKRIEGDPMWLFPGLHNIDGDCRSGEACHSLRPLLLVRRSLFEALVSALPGSSGKMGRFV